MASIDDSRSDAVSARDAVRPAGGPVDLGRRKWLTGMLAGPAVVSLPHTASASMASISTCIENYTSKQSIPYHVSFAEQDQYAREQVPGICAYKGNVNGNGGGYKEVLLISSRSGDLIDAEYNKWQWDGSNKIVDMAGNKWNYDSSMIVPNRYRLIFGVVDEFGQFLTDNYEQMNAMPLTISCEASIAPFI
jgi:hypothetical protein